MPARYYSPVIFASVGVPEFSGTLVVGIVNLLACVAGMWAIDRLGRKWLLLDGALGQGVCLFIAAALLTGANGGSGGGYLVALMICCFVMFFGMTWGPGAWVVTSEIYPLRIRGKALSVSTSLGNWLGNFLVRPLLFCQLLFCSLACYFAISLFCLLVSVSTWLPAWY